ncbi:MAG: YkgJ family cysteine cluster protein [Polaromonas sp.]
MSFEPIPGMPGGKPAGVRCAQLDDTTGCRCFGQPGLPAVCGQLAHSAEMCGTDRTQAPLYLARLETLTAPQ